MSVKQASKPYQFLKAERKAAAEAERAFSRIATSKVRDPEGLLREAYEAKERQILNQNLYREALAFEKVLKKGREKMMAYNKPKVREALAGQYIQQIDALLSDYDFRIRAEGQIKNAEGLKSFSG